MHVFLNFFTHNIFCRIRTESDVYLRAVNDVLELCDKIEEIELLTSIYPGRPTVQRVFTTVIAVSCVQ